jgi:hypothetical protein
MPNDPPVTEYEREYCRRGHSFQTFAPHEVRAMRGW